MRLRFDRRRFSVPPDQPVHGRDAYLERVGDLLPRPFPSLPCGYDPLPEIDRQWCGHERIRSKPIDRRKGVPLSEADPGGQKGPLG